MVSANTTAAHTSCWKAFWCMLWSWILDFFYTLWVLRALVTGVVVGTLLLMVPQSEDLFVQLATGSWFRMIEFLLLLFLVWAAMTHYGARLLVDADQRYLQWFANRPAAYG